MTCLLCESESVRTCDSLSKKQLIELWRDLGFDVAAKAFDCISNATTVDLQKCDSCGFQFFNPSLVGDSRFYDELFSQSPAGYYSPMRPEFEWALPIARREGAQRVLDVGCGNGFFLEYFRKAGFETFGLEYSPSAASAAREKGFVIVEKKLGDCMPEDFGGTFDLICLFQVLEHVPNPVQFIRDAARLVKPGGSLIIAVPTEEGLPSKLAPYEPHRWPPHHLSWWRKKDFATLAGRAGLQLNAVGYSILNAETISYFGKVGIRESKILKPNALTFPPRLFWFIAGCFKRLGGEKLKLRGGHGMFAHLSKRS